MPNYTLWEDLSTDEQRNEILKGIFNQLAGINKSLEVITILYAKLNLEDLDEIQGNTAHVSTLLDDHAEASRIGYSDRRGLYMVDEEGFNAFPLGYGNHYIDALVDKDTGYFKKEGK